MTSIETPAISQIAELLASKGHEVTEAGEGVIRVRDMETGITFRAALSGNILFMTVNLETCPTASITLEMMRKMLDARNGISTSSFQLYDMGDERTAITLNNFCTLQNMGEEDNDDILSLVGYLMADLMAARELLEPGA